MANSFVFCPILYIFIHKNPKLTMLVMCPKPLTIVNIMQII